MENIIEKARVTQAASKILAGLSAQEKNICIKNMIKALTEDKEYIVSQNSRDMERGRENGMPLPLLDRLLLDEKRINSIINSLEQVISLEDPVGEIIGMDRMQNGLLIGRMRVPLGVVGIIYEARPNVTVDAAALCLKSGNAVILRGGSEAIESNKALVGSLKKALRASLLPEDAISIIEDTSREAVNKMMKLNEYIDVLIPRGGAGLIKATIENSTIPVIETGTGNCHIYVDSFADLDMAERIVINAKTSRPGVCNAAEKLLVHQDVAAEFVPRIVKALISRNVEVRGCEKVLKICSDVIPATEEDWYTEYLDYIMGIKIVANIDEALSHIDKYSTRHSEAIITENYTNSQYFLLKVDSAAVYVNASTRFTDGNEFGLGAEIGISTQKIHARGPMGLKELTSTKYIIYGNGQIRE